MSLSEAVEPHEPLESKPPTDTCNARKKDGSGHCTQPAGSRTDHPGEGRCWLHGGATPIRHGRYSTISRERLRDLVDQYREDPDPLDLTAELAVARSLLHNYLEREEELQEAFLKWNTERMAEGKKPHRPPSLEDAIGLVSEISKIVKRIEDIRSQDALSRPELARIYSEMYRAVQMCADDDTAQEIARAWQQIRL